MRRSVPYLKKRGDVFYYIRRLPGELAAAPAATSVFGKSLTFRQSLRTKSYHAAVRNLGEIELKFQQMVTVVRESLIEHDSDKSKPVNLDDIKKPVEEIVRNVLSELEKDRSNGENNEVDALFYKHRVRSFGNAVRGIQKSITESSIRFDDFNFIDLHDFCEQLFSMHGFEIKNKVKKGRALLRLKEGKFERFSDSLELIEPDSNLLHSTLTTSKIVAPSANFESSNPIRLSDAVDRHLKHREFPARTMTETNSAMRQFIEIHGDMELNKIDTSHVRDLIEKMGQRVVGAKSDSAVERRISPNTVKKSIRLLSAAVGHSIKVGDWEGVNPFRTGSISALVPPQDPTVMPPKRRFEIGELAKVLSYPWFKGSKSRNRRNIPGNLRLNDMYFWVPMVAMFTGCRASELGGLKLDEVKMESSEPFPHFVMVPNEYRNIKKFKRRSIPIHNELMRLGFDRYVQGISNSDRLFPDWEPKRNKQGEMIKTDAGWSNGRIIRSFNEELIPNVFDLEVGKKRRELTFNSFRGAFKSMLQLAKHGITPNVINSVLGHEMDGMDKHYIKTVPLSETYDLVVNTGYPNLKLPLSPYL